MYFTSFYIFLTIEKKGLVFALTFYFLHQKNQKSYDEKYRRLLFEYFFFGNIPRGLNGSVNVSGNCDFRSQFDPFYITFWPFIQNTFLLAYTFWMKKYKISKSVSFKITELLTKTHLISNKRDRMLLSLVSPGWGVVLGNDRSITGMNGTEQNDFKK